MALVGELLAGAVVGTLFAELYKGVKELRGENTGFKCHLENLNSTLDYLKPLIFEQIGELNVKLGLPTFEIEHLKRTLEEGAELVGRLGQFRRRDLLMKHSYSNQLAELDRSLKRLLDILKVQEARDVKETLLEVRQLAAKFVQVVELLITVVKKVKVRQEPKDAKETLLSVAQTSKQLVELEASTRRLLDKPAVQREAINVQETRDFMRRTERSLERVNQNGVLKDLASLVQRTAVGAVLQELCDALYKVKDKNFKIVAFLKPLIEEMQAGYYKVVLDGPEEELERFKVNVEALNLLRSKVCRGTSSYIQHKYGNQLLAILEKSLQKLLDILKVQELSNVNETNLVSVRNIGKILIYITACYAIFF